MIFSRLAMFALMSFILSYASSAEITSGQNPAGEQLVSAYGTLPLAFEANHGQTDPRVKFVARGSGYLLYLTPTEAVLQFTKLSIPRRSDNRIGGYRVKRAELNLKLLGSNPRAELSGESELPGTSNYFNGLHPQNWHTNIPNYRKVRYGDIYPGVDLIFYGGGQGLEFDFSIRPGADPKNIRFQLEGASKISVDKNGDLLVVLPKFELRLRKPQTYQDSDGSRIGIDGRYAVRDGNEVSFVIAGHNPTRSLVIDPVLSFSTYIGGDPSVVNAVAVDSAGDTFIAAQTPAFGFSTSNENIFGTRTCHPGDEQDVVNTFLAKFDAAGDTILYSAVIQADSGDGGSCYNEAAYGIAVDKSGNAYATGVTNTMNFPTVNPIQDCTDGINQAFALKLDPTGSILLYSTCLGGTSPQSNSAGMAIAVDSSSHALVTGTTGPGFPIVNAVQSTYGGGNSDAFVAKLNPAGNALVYATYLGGSGDEDMVPAEILDFSENGDAGIAVDNSGNAYITGTTTSINFPTAKPIQTTGTVYLTKLSSSGTVLDYSTYLNGKEAHAVAVDTLGNSYVIGSGSLGALVTKVNSAGSAIVYSSSLGGSTGTSYGLGIAIDSSQNVYVSGETTATDFPTLNAIQTKLASVANGCFQGNQNFCPDAFVAHLSSSGALFSSTYLGGEAGDSGRAIAMDSFANLYVVGSTSSLTFPVANPYQGLCLWRFGYVCNSGFVSKISIPVFLSPSSVAFGNQVTGTLSTKKNVTVMNNLSTPLKISNISTSADFDQTNTCGNSVPAASSCTVSITFRPLSVGSISGAVTISDNATNAPQVIGVSGTGMTPLSISPGTLAFGFVPIGSKSVVKTATLTNKQRAAVSIMNVTTSGDYSQTNSCGSILAPGAACNVNVIFKPTAQGAINGAVTVIDNAGGSPHVVNLSGTGTGSIRPTLKLSPASLVFGDQVIQTESPQKTVTLTNTGASRVTISNIVASGDYSETNSCPGSLTAGSSCSIKVSFLPTNLGHITGAVTASDTANTSPQVLNLSGIGVLPITFTPTSLLFGQQFVGTTSSSKTLTLKNGQTTSIAITSIVASGAYSETNNCGASVPGGGSCSVTITFTPSGVRSFPGAVTVMDNGSVNAQTVGVSGSGVSPAILAATADGTGAGAISSTPRGINCSTTCSANYFVGTVVTLMATPNTGSTFAGWNGCDSASGNSCTLTMTYDKNVTATFN